MLLCPASIGTLRNPLPSVRESRAEAASGSPVTHYPMRWGAEVFLGQEQVLPSLTDTAPAYGRTERSRRTSVFPSSN